MMMLVVRKNAPTQRTLQKSLQSLRELYSESKCRTNVPVVCVYSRR